MVWPLRAGPIFEGGLWGHACAGSGVDAKEVQEKKDNRNKVNDGFALYKFMKINNRQRQTDRHHCYSTTRPIIY